MGTTKEPREAIEEINGILKDWFDQKTARVLEAGCGSLSHVKLAENSYVVGIDISQEQLDRNEYLDEAILGNIEESAHFNREFDIIVCWDVLEHVNKPHLALRNFADSLADGGKVVVKVPNIRSLKGLITRHTPHPFHVFVYKHILGKSGAGNPGFPPFPTTMREVIAPSSMREYCSQLGLEMEYSWMFDALPQKVREKKVLAALYSGLNAIIGLLTRNKYGGANSTDFVCILSNRTY